MSTHKYYSMNNLKEGVMDYVNIMAKQGAKAVDNNPNSETSMLNRELINYYKNNTLKAHAIINSASSGTYASPEHRMQVQAATIALNGYPLIASATHINEPSINDTLSELDKLKRAGWKPLNEQKASELLLG